VIDVLAIDSARCRDPAVVGAKAARLARARAAGLPVPDSMVVPCAASGPVLAAAAQIAARHGIHAGRLEVMSADRTGLAELVPQTRPLGAVLAVRSSSPREDEPDLAGAYGSMIGVRPEEFPTAVLSVWASALLDRATEGPTEPETPLIGVLVQRELAPVFAGTAEILADESAEVIMTAGSAAGLMAGWEPGQRSVVSPSADAPPPPADSEAEAALLAAALAWETAAKLGDNLIEWALAAGRIWLLQTRRVERARPAPRTGSPVGSAATFRALARATRYPGELAERWMLPWVVAWDRGFPTAEVLGAQLDQAQAAAWQQLREASDQLTAQVWKTPVSHSELVADQVRAGLRAGSLGQAELSRLAAPDPALVARFAAAAWCLTAHLQHRGAIASASQFWALPADIGPLLSGSPPTDSHARSLRAALAWEPYLYEGVMALGHRLAGRPVSAGTGCGRAVLASQVTKAGELTARTVLVAEYPAVRYAQLLMGAAGLVTNAGSGAAHLMTVARSLGVPAVVECDLTSLIRERAATYVAVDGEHGEVGVLADPAATPECVAMASAGPEGWFGG
jgi:phosphohistidine swiveling domain-containing protein